jgi:hypothetical protein
MSAKPDPKKVLEEALQLEPTSRAFIAETLLHSLDFEQDYPISQEWLEEIRHRCSEIDGGKAELLDNPVVINELRAKYS